MEAPVELQPFNPDGTGPQGSGGIPPEEFSQTLADQGTDLVGASRRPEDSAAAQAVLDREVTSLAGQLGVVLPPDDRPREPQAPAEPATPEAASHAAPAVGDAPPEDLATKIRNVKQKFGGDFGKLAEAYTRSNAEASRMASGLASENAQIRGELAGLNAKLSRIVDHVSGAMPAQGQGPSARTEPTPLQIDDETFRERPVESVAQIVRSVVRDEFVAVEQARARIDEQRQLRDIERQNQADIDRLRPVMAEMYRRDPDVYSQMGETRALNFLLERAKEREFANQAAAFYDQFKDIDPDQAGAPAGAVAPVVGHPGTIQRSGAVSARARAVAGGPQNGNWSTTQGMRRLYGQRDGTSSEAGALVDVLRERGHGEHLG